MAQATFASFPPPRQGVSEASIADLAVAMRRHWRYVAVPTLLALVGALIFVNVVSPRYTGEAKVLLQYGDSYYTRPTADRGDQTQLIDEQAVASQVQVVMSRDLAREAIRRLKLVGNPEFDPGVKEVSLLQRLAIMIGLAKDPAVRAPEDRILDKYFDNLLVYPVGKSRIVSIEFRSKDADLAANAANTIAELYLGLQESAKKDLARSASNWLGANIDDLRTRVAEAEAKVEAFRSKTGLLVGSGTTTISAQQLSELSAQLAQARTAQGDAQARAQLIRDLVRDGRGFEIPDVANNELIRRLIEQRINLRAQLALELRTLLPQHPRIKELNAQLQDLDAQVRGAAERTARTLENDSRLAGARVEALEAAINQQKAVVAQANGGEVQLRALEREARSQRDQLESYLTRYREATARDVGNAAPPDARIVSRAVVPSMPSFPKKVPIIAITTFAALMLSAGAIIARELLGSAPADGGASLGSDGPAPPSRQRRYETALNPAPVAPAFEAGAAAPRLEAPRLAQPFRSPPPPPPEETDPRFDFGNLVERLSRTHVEDRARRILVCPVEKPLDGLDVGRSLALVLARTARTLLVELDPAEGTLTSVPGLTDLIAGEASFSDVIRAEAGSPLHRIGVGTLRNTALTGEPEGLDVAASALDKTYDWIVFALLGRDAKELLGLVAPRVDAVVIASSLEPANQDLVRAYESVREAGARDVIVAREQPVAEIESEAA